MFKPLKRSVSTSLVQTARSLNEERLDIARAAAELRQRVAPYEKIPHNSTSA